MRGGPRTDSSWRKAVVRKSRVKNEMQISGLQEILAVVGSVDRRIKRRAGGMDLGEL